MKHKWKPLPDGQDKRRECEKCGVIQTRLVQRGLDSDIGPLHITGYFWRPLAGRCPGRPKL